MSTITWNDMAADVTMFVADCPVFTITDQLKIVALEYFDASRAWRSSSPVTLATIVAGTDSYTVAGNPTGGELCGLPSVWINSDEVREYLPNDFAEFFPGQTGNADLGVGVTDGTTVRIAPMPTAGGGVIKAIAAYKPTLAATGLPDTIWYLARKTLRDKAIARLKMMQGKPWYDPAGATEAAQSGRVDALRVSSRAGTSRRNPRRTKMQVI